jgi:hypothetical protein
MLEHASARFKPSKVKLFVGERCILKYRNHRGTLEMRMAAIILEAAPADDRDPQIILEEVQVHREDVE